MQIDALDGQTKQIIKPTKIAGKFVLFGGGYVEDANVTRYSAFASLPSSYDKPTVLPSFTMFHTPVKLGSTGGIFCGAFDFPAPDNSLTAAVFFEGEIGFKTDIMLNRLKVDEARTLELDEKKRAKSSFEEWVKRCARCDTWRARLARG